LSCIPHKEDRFAVSCLPNIAIVCIYGFVKIFEYKIFRKWIGIIVFILTFTSIKTTFHWNFIELHDYNNIMSYIRNLPQIDKLIIVSDCYSFPLYSQINR